MVCIIIKKKQHIEDITTTATTTTIAITSPPKPPLHIYKFIVSLLLIIVIHCYTNLLISSSLLASSLHCWQHCRQINNTSRAYLLLRSSSAVLSHRCSGRGHVSRACTGSHGLHVDHRGARRVGSGGKRGRSSGWRPPCLSRTSTFFSIPCDTQKYDIHGDSWKETTTKKRDTPGEAPLLKPRNKAVRQYLGIGITTRLRRRGRYNTHSRLFGLRCARAQQAHVHMYKLRRLSRYQIGYIFLIFILL